MLCEIAVIPRSSYYKWLKYKPSSDVRFGLLAAPTSGLCFIQAKLIGLSPMEFRTKAARNAVHMQDRLFIKEAKGLRGLLLILNVSLIVLIDLGNGFLFL